jgi:hypothetical protein
MSVGAVMARPLNQFSTLVSSCTMQDVVWQ